MSDSPPDRPLSRRRFLRIAGLAAAAVPLANLIGCSASAVIDDALGGTDAQADATGIDARADAGPDAADAPGVDAAADATDTGKPDAGSGWATGGTASMSGKYKDPFTLGLGNACALTCAATLGPCYAATLDRQDISEGLPGLPVRMAFLVVDETCTPVPGASVDIWHTSPGGLYSGSDADPFCTSGDAKAVAARYFRGVRTAGADGRVDFDTLFPGWYRGRTIHIHLTVRVGQSEYVTSQLYFDDALSDEIINTQPAYDTRGARDTTNRTDGIAQASGVTDYLFETERQADGAMLAWKALVVRSSLASPAC